MKTGFDFLRQYKNSIAEEKDASLGFMKKLIAFLIVFALVLPAASFGVTLYYNYGVSQEKAALQEKLDVENIKQRYDDYINAEATYNLLKSYNDDIEAQIASVKESEFFNLADYNQVRSLEKAEMSLSDFSIDTNLLTFTYSIPDIEDIPEFVDSVAAIDAFSSVSYNGYTEQTVREDESVIYTFSVVCSYGEVIKIGQDEIDESEVTADE